MHRILITGRNSYIGCKLREYLQENFADAVDMVSVRDNEWKDLNFGSYDAVVHTAAVVHQKETEQSKQLYEAVNYRLTVQLAEKAQREGVKQFVFLSSVSVYGMETGVVHKDTQVHPKTQYAHSKLQAEEALRKMHSREFHVAILRIPMVYGQGCKGNYQMLERIAKTLPAFASYTNRRSLISVENLTKFLGDIIADDACGIFLPQDPQYCCTSRMIQELAQQNGKTMRLTPLLNPLVMLLKRFTKKGQKAFGDWIYVGDNACIEQFTDEDAAVLAGVL